MPAQKELSEVDILFNKSALALARQQKLLENIRAQLTTTASARQDDEDNDEAPFAPGSERLGIGAVAPKAEDNESVRMASSAARLRKELKLPKAAALKSRDGVRARDGTKGNTVPVRPADDSDEEEGRAATFQSRRKGREAQPRTDDTEEDSSKRTPDQKEDERIVGAQVDADGRGGLEEEAPVAAAASGTGSSRRRRPVSFLDEVLEKNAKKKKKKGSTT